MIFKFNISDNIFIMIFTAVVIMLIIDTQITRISVFVRLDRSSDIFLFITIVSVALVGQYIILSYVNHKNVQTSFISVPFSKIMHKVVTATQYVLAAILVTTILQILITSSYNVYLLESVVWISYGLSIVLMGFLSQRFFSWFRSTRSPLIFAYGLSMAALSATALFTPMYIHSDLENVPTVIVPMRMTGMAFGSAGNIFSGPYIVTSILSFIITWVATALLLRHYTERVGRARYWIVIIMPMIYFLSQFNALFVNLFHDIRVSNPIIFNIVYTIVFSATKPIGGVLFGLAFWKIARSVKQTRVKDYMIISGCGIMLLFITNQSSLLNAAPFPPFAMTSVAMVGMASYLLVVGIHTAAMSISQDMELRRTIKKFVKSESDLLSNIAASEVQRIVEKKVSSALKMVPPNEVIPSSLEEDDVKEYINQVIQEVKEKQSET